MGRSSSGGRGASSSASSTNATSIQLPKWPEAAPIKYEEKIMSIVCGNTHLHWAIHEGTKHGFVPVLFWRTPPLASDEKDAEPCEVLARHLPKQAHEIVFGQEEAPPSKIVAASVAARRRVPALSIYIISSNEDYESALPFLFQDVPHRLYKLSATDFFNKEQGLYDGIGVDRVAALRAAVDLHQYPVLVFDAGTALTYTAMDTNGNIMGGGISPGIHSRFRAMHDYCGALPIIEHKDFQKVIEEATAKRKPLPTFARDTKSAMIVDVLSEITGKCRGVIKHFLAHVRKSEKEDAKSSETIATPAESADASTETQPDAPPPASAPAPTPAEPANPEPSKTSSNPGYKPPPPAEDTRVDKRPAIAITGGDSLLLERLLSPYHSYIVPPEPGALFNTHDFALLPLKHLIHYGISACIKEKASQVNDDNPDNQLRIELTGQRVAKKFSMPDQDGDSDYRGTIVSIRTQDETSIEKDWFYVRYDDGDTEHYDIVQLYDGLQLYKEIGEKSSLNAALMETTTSIESKENPAIDFEQKRQDSQKSAESVLATSKRVQQEMEDRQSGKSMKPSPPARPPAKTKATGSSGAASNSGATRNQSVEASATSKRAAAAAAATVKNDGATPTSKRRKKSTDASTPTSQRKKRKEKVEKSKMYLNQRVAKAFELEDDDGNPYTEIYFGTIDSFVEGSEDDPLWHVQYDDQDEEEYDERDVKKGLKMYAKHGEKKDKKKPPATAVPNVSAEVEVLESPPPAGSTPDDPMEIDDDAPTDDGEQADKAPETSGLQGSESKSKDEESSKAGKDEKDSDKAKAPPSDGAANSAQSTTASSKATSPPASAPQEDKSSAPGEKAAEDAKEVAATADEGTNGTKAND